MKTMMDNKAADYSTEYTCLDTIRLSKTERSRAYASLRSGDQIAGFVLGAVAETRAIARRVESMAASLASGIKAMLAKPVKR